MVCLVEEWWRGCEKPTTYQEDKWSGGNSDDIGCVLCISNYNVVQCGVPTSKVQLNVAEKPCNCSSVVLWNSVVSSFRNMAFIVH